MIKWFVAIAMVAIAATGVHAQDPKRFQKEVDEIQKNDSAYKNSTVTLFTGSSTIRMWKSLKADFKDKPVVNHGFGGSEMSDLLYFADDLILQYRPRQIFIYEGDNDISSGKTATQILATADSLIRKIRGQHPAVPIYFISAKPSKARWHLKSAYLEFNGQLKTFVSKYKNVYYIDLWSPMLDRNGVVKEDIFIEDGLHMNDKGYAIWQKKIGKYLN